MNDIWSTVDGSSWTEETQAPFPAMKVDVFGLLNNRIVILGGNMPGSTEWYSEIWASDPATPPPTPIPTFPAWGGGFFQSDHGGGQSGTYDRRGLAGWRVGDISKFRKARSRLYRSQILQVNTRWNSYLVGKLLARSTRFTCFCTAQTSISADIRIFFC